MHTLKDKVSQSASPRFSNSDSPKSNKEEEDEGEEELEDNEGQIHYNSYVYQRPNPDSVQNVLIQGTSGNEIKRKRGRPRRIQNPSEETEVLDLTGEAFVDISMDSNPAKRKRGRPPKNRDDFTQPAVNLENREGTTTMVDVSALDKEDLVNLENREVTVVDLSALANVLEDPYEEELRRITVGL